MQTLRDAAGRNRRTGVWRFTGGGETFRAITMDGPVCDSFDHPRGEVGPYEGRFGMRALAAEGRPWRRVRGNRFVPPGETDDSEVFVEWRREDGRWVVSVFGEEAIYLPRVLGVELGMIIPDTTGVPEEGAPYARYAAGHSWYEDDAPVTLRGFRYVKYGLPRRFTAEERGYLGRIGALGAVSVYAERALAEPRPGIVYLPVSPGEFQPYTGFGPLPCA